MQRDQGAALSAEEIKTDIIIKLDERLRPTNDLQEHVVKALI